MTFYFGGSDFDSLVRLSRDTGRVELIELTRVSGSWYSLDLNLAGGTGDLFAFWNSHDPLPTVPEPSMAILAMTGLIGASAYAWKKRQ